MAETNNTIKTTVVLDVTKTQQQLIKLGATASDSTKELEERVEAKNKQVDLQNKLSNQTIKNLEKEIDILKDFEGEEKNVIKLQSKLNKERIKATKLNENGIKQQNKLNEKLADSSSATKQLDESTGGLLGKMKAFVTNPIGATIAVIAGAYAVLSKAISRSGKASKTFNKISSKLSGVLNGVLAVLEPLVIFFGETLLKAMEDPKQAFIDLGTAIKENLINRVKSVTILWGAVTKLLKGDFKGAAKDATDAFIQMGTGVEDGTDKIKKYSKEAKKTFDETAKATQNLANKEVELAKNRIALEKQQLSSLRLAEAQRQIRDDTSKSMKERIEANKKLGVILDEQTKREMKLAQQNLNIANQEVKASGQTIENLEAVGDAEIKLLEIQERIEGQRSEQIVNRVALEKEDADKKKKEKEDAEKIALEDETKRKERAERDLEAQIELDEIELNRKREKGENILALELELLERKKAQELANLDLTEKEKAVIEQTYADASAKVKDDANKAKTKSDKSAKDSAIGFVSEAFGVEKEAAIASMIMKAPEAIGNSFAQAAKSYPAPLSLAMGALGASSTVVPIIKGLADIKKTRFSGSKGGSKGGGGSISSSGGGGGGAPIGDISANNSARLGIDPSLGSNATADASNSVSGNSSSNVVFSEDKYSSFQRQVEFKENKTTI